MSWSGSGTSVYGRPYLAANLACAAALSGEMPMMAAFFLVKVFWVSRNSQASVVQPGVSALGKKNTTTRRPFKPASENSEVLMSGALSPTWIAIRQDCRLVTMKKGILTFASLGLLLSVGVPMATAA